MSDLSVKRNSTYTSTYTLTLSEAYAAKVSAALGRAMAALDKLDVGARDRLVNTGTFDTLLALKTALYDAMPEDGPASAKLPASMRWLSVADAVLDKTYFTLPWAMASDDKGGMWLDSAYPLEPGMHETFQMRVIRRPDGYHVWPPKGRPYTVSSRTWLNEPVPVVKLHTEGEEA